VYFRLTFLNSINPFYGQFFGKVSSDTKVNGDSLSIRVSPNILSTLFILISIKKKDLNTLAKLSLVYISNNK